MSARPLTKRRAIAALAAGCLLAGATSALAEVTVYDNDFATQGRYDEIERSGGGKRCERKYREKSKVLLASLKKAPATCAFRPPVQGDDDLPNHELTIDAKILKRTPKSARKGCVLRAHGPRRRQGFGLFAADLPRAPALRAATRSQGLGLPRGRQEQGDQADQLAQPDRPRGDRRRDHRGGQRQGDRPRCGHQPRARSRAERSALRSATSRTPTRRPSARSSRSPSRSRTPEPPGDFDLNRHA